MIAKVVKGHLTENLSKVNLPLMLVLSSFRLCMFLSNIENYPSLLFSKGDKGITLFISRNEFFQAFHRAYACTWSYRVIVNKILSVYIRFFFLFFFSGIALLGFYPTPFEGRIVGYNLPYNSSTRYICGVFEGGEG